MPPREDELRMLYFVNLEAYGCILEHGYIPEIGIVADGNPLRALELLDQFENEAVRVEKWDEAVGVTDELLSTDKMKRNPAYTLTCTILRQMSCLLYLTAEKCGVLSRGSETQLWNAVKENVFENPAAHEYFASIPSESLEFDFLIEYLRQENDLLEAMVKPLQMSLADVTGLGEMAALKGNIYTVTSLSAPTSPSISCEQDSQTQYSRINYLEIAQDAQSANNPTSRILLESPASYEEAPQIERPKSISSPRSDLPIDPDEKPPTATPNAQLSSTNPQTLPILHPIQEEQGSSSEAFEVITYLLNFFHSPADASWKDFRSSGPQGSSSEISDDWKTFTEAWKKYTEAWHALNTRVGHGKQERRKSWSDGKRLRQRSRSRFRSRSVDARRASIGSVYNSFGEQDEVEEYLGFFDEFIPEESKTSENTEDEATVVSPTNSGVTLMEDQFGWAYVEGRRVASR